MAPFDATSTNYPISTSLKATKIKSFRAIVLDPIHPEGNERARLYSHPNAVNVWEGHKLV